MEFGAIKSLKVEFRIKRSKKLQDQKQPVDFKPSMKTAPNQKDLCKIENTSGHLQVQRTKFSS